MRYKLLEILSLYLLFPILFLIGILKFEDRFYYFGLLGIFLIIQSIRYRNQIRFQFKANLKSALGHGIKLSLFSIVLIYPFNVMLNIQPFHNLTSDYLLFVFIFYPFVSAPLQEYFFRTYYYARFKGINRSLLFWYNIITFGLIHYMYGGILAVYFSVISGLIINLNYRKHQNDLAISGLHGIHGIVIFLLGYTDYFTDLFKQ